jgi:flotillin
MNRFVLLAADPINVANDIPWMALLAGAVALVFLGMASMLFKRYKRCPSNKILVIYGKVAGGVSSRCIHGGAAFVMPLIQDHAYLSLEPI